MIRKQVYLEQRHDRMLKHRARERGVTEAEIIREALTSVELAGGSASARSPHPDSEAGHKALDFMRSLANRRSKAPGGRAWTREQLYEERVGRWAKS